MSMFFCTLKNEKFPVENRHFFRMKSGCKMQANQTFICVANLWNLFAVNWLNYLDLHFDFSLIFQFFPTTTNEILRFELTELFMGLDNQVFNHLIGKRCLGISTQNSYWQKSRKFIQSMHNKQDVLCFLNFLN